MSLSSATLSSQLQSISASNESAAITAWTSAWSAYFAGAIAGSGPGVAFTSDPTAIANAKADMATALAGISSSGLADDKVQAGIIAWWDRLVAHPGDYFAGASAVSKPSGLTGIAASLASIFITNRDSALSALAACNSISSAIHTANSGGTATIGTSKAIT